LVLRGASPLPHPQDTHDIGWCDHCEWMVGAWAGSTYPGKALSFRTRDRRQDLSDDFQSSFINQDCDTFALMKRSNACHRAIKEKRSLYVFFQSWFSSTC